MSFGELVDALGPGWIDLDQSGITAYYYWDFDDGSRLTVCGAFYSDTRLVLGANALGYGGAEMWFTAPTFPPAPAVRFAVTNRCGVFTVFALSATLLIFFTRLAVIRWLGKPVKLKIAMFFLVGAWGLCVTLWVRQAWRGDRCVVELYGHSSYRRVILEIASAHGHFSAAWSFIEDAAKPAAVLEMAEISLANSNHSDGDAQPSCDFPFAKPVHSLRWRGFSYQAFETHFPGDAIINRTGNVVLPVWSVALLIPGVPLCIYFRRRQVARWRRYQGRCICCNYDLRMTPDWCPECGAVAAPPIRQWPISRRARPPATRPLR